MRRTLVALAAGASLGLVLACSSGTSEAPASGETAATAKAGSSAADPALIERGRALYKANCVACHGEGGKGDGPAAGVMKPPPRDHTDAAYMRTLSDKDIADIIKMGGAVKGKPLMPSHPQFKDPDLQALVAYVRSLSQSAD